MRTSAVLAAYGVGSTLALGFAQVVLLALIPDWVFSLAALLLTFGAAIVGVMGMVWEGPRGSVLSASAGLLALVGVGTLGVIPLTLFALALVAANLERRADRRVQAVAEDAERGTRRAAGAAYHFWGRPVEAFPIFRSPGAPKPRGGPGEAPGGAVADGEAPPPGGEP